MKAQYLTRACAQNGTAGEDIYHARTRRIAAFAAACAVLLLGAGALAQNYSINWYKIAGGGGASTGGVFSVIVNSPNGHRFYRLANP